MSRGERHQGKAFKKSCGVPENKKFNYNSATITKRCREVLKRHEKSKKLALHIMFNEQDEEQNEL